MDLNTAFICLGVIVGSAIILYLISVLGIKEKTYEEAIAEQRRKDEEVQLQKKSDKGPKDKKHKKWGRKSKEKTDKGGEDVPHVDFKPEAEIIPEDDDDDKKPPLSAAKKAKKVDEPKSILAIKKEKSPSVGKDEVKAAKPPAANSDVPTKEDVNVVAAAQVSAKEPSPKLEAIKDKKEKTPPSSKTEEGKDAKEVKKESVKEEPFQKEKSKTPEDRVKREDGLQSSQPTNTMSPGKKAKKNKLDDEVLNCARLASLIKSSVLSQNEIHSLIETLLNKQQQESGDSEWSKIGQKIDPISALRKQLQEKEEALTEERQKALATGTKLKEVRQELNSERSNRQHLDRAVKERQQEVQNLNSQLQRSTSDAQANQAKYQQLQAKLTEETNALQALKDENGQLRQSLGQIESGSSGLQLENEKLRNDIAQAEIKCQKLQEVIESLEMDKNGIGSTYEQTITDLKNRLAIAEEEIVAYSSKLYESGAAFGSLEKDKEGLQQKVAELLNELTAKDEAENKLKEYGEDLKDQKACLEVQISTLQSQLQEINNRLMASDKELQAQKEHNELLAAQISKVTEREEAEGQEGGGDHVTTDKTNGHIQLEDSGDQTKMLLSEHEQILHEKEKIVDQLTAELKEKAHEIQELSRQVLDLQDEIARLSTEADKQKEKNNELREKNWKIMEALKQAENSANENRKQAEKLANETILDIRKTERKATQDILEQIFPSIRIDKSIAHLEWVAQFEKQAQHTLDEALSSKQNVSEVDELQSRLEAAEEAYNKQQAQVLHYKTSLVETEGILKKIQGSVEEEELKWKEKLEAKEQQLEKLLEEKKSYEASLGQVRAAEEAAVEMQEKLTELKDKLQSEENERRSLEVQRLEVEKVASSLREQLSQAEEQLQKWKLEREGISERAKEVDALKDELEKLKQSHNDLQSHNVKLESLVKIGVESVRLEQETVKLLKSKLEGAAYDSENTIIPATNGPPPTDCDTSNLESSRVGLGVNEWPSSLSAVSSSLSYSPLQQQQPPSPANSTTNMIATPSTSKKAKNKKRAASVKK